MAETTRFCCVEKQGKELKKEKIKLNFLKKCLCLCHVAIMLLFAKQGLSTVLWYNRFSKLSGPDVLH